MDTSTQPDQTHAPAPAPRVPGYDSVERRWADRVEVHMPVLFYDEGKLLLAGTARNISLEGMFVACSIARLASRDLLVAEFRPPGHPLHFWYRMMVAVTYLQEDGAGFAFIGFNRGTFRAIQRLTAR